MAGESPLKALVLLHVVVPGCVERNHVHVVLEFLGERIGEPGKAARLHPHREVLALGIGRADGVTDHVGGALLAFGTSGTTGHSILSPTR